MDVHQNAFSVGLPSAMVLSGSSTWSGRCSDQDHENLELVICDNASTDDTEELCRELANQDSRIVYHRNPVNIGLLNNFIRVMQLFEWHVFPLGRRRRLAGRRTVSREA